MHPLLAFLASISELRFVRFDKLAKLIAAVSRLTRATIASEAFFESNQVVFPWLQTGNTPLASSNLPTLYLENPCVLDSSRSETKGRSSSGETF